MKSPHVCSGKGTGSGKTQALGFTFRLKLSTETVDSYLKNKHIKQTLDKGEDMISRVIILLDSNVQCSTTTTTKKSHKLYRDRKL